jgi:toxin-antitoxin system PIN domain toxin
MRALLDVNVLIALFDADHVHHRRAWQWFEVEGRRGWSTCPLTQNGCIRVMAQPGYPNPVPVSSLIDRLRAATAAPEHAFWADDTSLLDPARFDALRIHGPRQVTDLYLLGLAVAHGGRFATFDAGVPVSAVRGAAAKHLSVL